MFSSPIWTFVLVVLTFISTMAFVVQCVSLPKPSLRAIVYGQPHYHILDWEKLEHVEDKTIQKLTLFTSSKYPINSIQGVYRILLINAGNSVAKNTKIFVGDAIGMKIIRNNKTNVITGEEASIGDISPDEEVEVISWTIRNTKLYTFLPPNIKVHHDNGIAELDYRYEITGFLRNLHNHRYYIFLGLMIFGIAIAVGTAIAVGINTSSRSEENPDNSDDKN